MPEQQREIGVLADPENDDEQDAQGKARDDIRVDDRNLVDGGVSPVDQGSGVERSDGAERSQYSCQNGRGESQNDRSENHVPEFFRRKETDIVIERETLESTDLGGVRKAVEREHENRNIQEQKDEYDESKSEFSHYSIAPPLLTSPSPTLSVRSVNPQITARRISAIIEPPCQL